MPTPMPQDVYERLEAARVVALRWINLQHASNKHLMNTGKRDYVPAGVYADMRKRGVAALEEIERIKREYPS